MIATAGAALAIDLFPAACWRGRRRVDEFAVTDAYPGPRPVGSFCVRDGYVTGLDPVTGGGWLHRDSGHRVNLAGRRLVLAYGSNLDPVKLSVNLHGVVYALRAAVVGHAAVWCAARRCRDGAVVATLAPVAGRIEVHGLLAVTEDQLARMDDWEGHPDYYRRDDFRGTVLLEDGTSPENVLVYLGTRARRPTLLIDGEPLLCARLPQAQVDRLVEP